MAEPTTTANPDPSRPPSPPSPPTPSPPTPPPPARTPPRSPAPPAAPPPPPPARTPPRFPAPPAAPPPPPPPAPPTPPAASAEPTPGTGHRRHRRALSLAAAGLLVVGATGGAVLVNALDDGSDPVVAAQSSLDVPADPVARADSDEPLAQAAAEVLPSVVSVATTDGRSAGEGSGVIISSDGLVLTNNHVVALVADGGGELEVTLPDGSTAPATIEGRDPASDLAVIRVQDQEGLTAATFGSSADLQVGETVLAVGSPLGLDGSVTAGIVSAVGRAITLGDDPTAPAAVVSAIQTDAAINPGNSGGALVNAEGEVVGINTANASLAQSMGGQSGSIGLGFAIPIDEARDIAGQLIDDGEATHAYLGVQSAESEDGVTLAAVMGDGPAAEAGLEEGDVVTAIDDTRVTDVASLTAAIRSHDPGDEVTVHITRGGEDQEVTVTLGTLPSSSS